MHSRPLRIMHVMHEFNVGGAENYIRRLIEELDRQRFVSMVHSLTTGGITSAVLEKAGVPVSTGGMDKGPRGITGWLRCVPRLALLARRHRVDILHTHGHRTGYFGRDAGILARVPVLVHSVHGIEAYKRAGRRREIQRARHTDAIVAVSEAVKLHYVDQLGIPGQEVTVIPGGVDERVFVRDQRLRNRYRHRLGTSPRELWLGIVARVDGHKGHLCLLRSLARLVPRHPHIRLAVVGDGPELGRLQREASELGVASYVRWLGFQGEEEVVGWLNAMDIFVLPSENEGLPLAILEAMACELPVVATSVGGVPEVVCGQCGRLVPGPSEQALSKALDELLSLPTAKLGDRGRAGRQIVLERFSLRSCVTAHECLYLRLAKRVAG